MQGQIIRVKGRFSNANMPKLSDFDTTSLLNEILNHPACVRFYDFTNIETLVLNDNKIVEAKDIKGGTSFIAAEDKAPTYNDSALNGKGGAVFNGAHFGSIDNFTMSANMALTLDIVVLNTIVDSENRLYWASSSNSAFATYYRTSSLGMASGKFLYNAADGWASDKYNINRIDLSLDYSNNDNKSGGAYINNKELINNEEAAYPSITNTTILNVGKWKDDLEGYGYFILGHLAFFSSAIHKDAYLNKLLHEYYLRHYRV